MSRHEHSPRGAPDDPKRDGARLRLARLAHGLSQQDAATAAGVTRQAVAGFEAGQWDPSLRVAMALARALDTTVEDLFGPVATLPPVDAVPLGPLPAEPTRVELGQVGTTAVALPLTGSGGLRAGFVPSDGTATRTGGSERCEVRPVAPPRPSLLVAGCDPALPLLRGPLSRLDRPVNLQWWPCGSDEALRLAAAGLVHVAGFHVSTRTGDDRARVTLEQLYSADTEVMQFASWMEGLATRPEMAPPVADLTDVARHGLRFVNREPGAEARDLIDRERQRLGVDAGDIDGYDSAVGGHLLAASALAARVGDVGVTIEPAALAYGLPFVPLAMEQSLLAVPQRFLSSPEVQALLRVLATSAVRNQLASLPGYQDTNSCGVRLTAR
ncbi:MAG: helix-turn-helix domain-containing protein [Actinomycetota bacterium]|nr:helix-turn-helix domain-containing protein [Actinomycetota bacterium]